MKKYRFILSCCAFVGFTLLLGAGCNNISADQACTDSAMARCTIFDRCRTNGTQIFYGSLDTCISRLKGTCLTELAAPSAGNRPEDLEECAMALPTESCQDYLQRNPVAACVTRNGGLETGAVCSFDTQCKTGFCAQPKGGTCGICKAAPGLGDSCTDIGCDRNLVCTSNNVCRNWVAAAGACDRGDNLCGTGLSCVIAAGQSTGTCQPRVKTVGAACDNKRQTAPDCDFNVGLFCDATTLKCAPQTYANANQQCSAEAIGSSPVVCIAGGTCINPGDGNPSTCMAAVDAGSACDISTGPSCLSPTRCEVNGNSTSGICLFPGAQMCLGLFYSR